MVLVSFLLDSYYNTDFYHKIILIKGLGSCSYKNRNTRYLFYYVLNYQGVYKEIKLCLTICKLNCVYRFKEGEISLLMLSPSSNASRFV